MFPQRRWAYTSWRFIHQSSTIFLLQIWRQLFCRSTMAVSVHVWWTWRHPIYLQVAEQDESASFWYIIREYEGKKTTKHFFVFTKLCLVERQVLTSLVRAWVDICGDVSRLEKKKDIFFNKLFLKIFFKLQSFSSLSVLTFQSKTKKHIFICFYN